jgi:hypothetical protein
LRLPNWRRYARQPVAGWAAAVADLLALDRAAYGQGGESRKVGCCFLDVAKACAWLRLITTKPDISLLPSPVCCKASTAATPATPTSTSIPQIDLHNYAPRIIHSPRPLSLYSRLFLDCLFPPSAIMSSRQCLRLAAGASLRPAVRAAPRYATRSAAALRCLSTSSVSRSSALLSQQPR